MVMSLDLYEVLTTDRFIVMSIWVNRYKLQVVLVAVFQFRINTRFELA